MIEIIICRICRKNQAESALLCETSQDVCPDCNDEHVAECRDCRYFLTH